MIDKINREAVESAARELLRLTMVFGAALLVSWLTGITEGLDSSSLAAVVIGLVIKFLDRYAYKAKGVNVTKI